MVFLMKNTWCYKHVRTIWLLISNDVVHILTTGIEWLICLGAKFSSFVLKQMKWCGPTVQHAGSYFGGFVLHLFNDAASNLVKVDGHEGLIILKQPVVTYFKSVSTNSVRGTRWCSWLRHCATSRTVAGSNPGGVTGIFNWHCICLVCIVILCLFVILCIC
jgi:hypothetical protein